MIESRSSGMARVRRKDRDRQQKRRDKLKQSRTPTTHTLDRALSHGVMVATASEIAKGRDLKEISVPVTSVLFEASNQLTADTHANNRYDRDEVMRALVRRLKKYTPER